MVMGVGLDPELTKWSMRAGPAIVLTRKGYKEHHWLVVPHQPLWLSPLSPYLTKCLLPFIPSLVLPITLGSVMLLSMSIARLGPIPVRVGPLLPSCTMKRNTE